MGAELANYYNLEKETLHLWFVDVGAKLDSRYYNLLCENEKIRAGKYRFAHDQYIFYYGQGGFENIIWTLFTKRSYTN